MISVAALERIGKSKTPAPALTGRGHGPTGLESNVFDVSADHPRNTVAVGEWLAGWIERTRPTSLSDAEVFVLRRGWADDLQFGGLSPEAFMLHFKTWSATSFFPKWRGHISLTRDRGILYNRALKTVHAVRNELVKAGLRQWCQGDGYKLCDEWCQSIVDWVPSVVASSPQADALRRAARTILPTESMECEQCGANADLTVDHIVPIARGGGNDSANLRVLCRSCNSRKGARF